MLSGVNIDKMLSGMNVDKMLIISFIVTKTRQHVGGWQIVEWEKC